MKILYDLFIHLFHFGIRTSASFGNEKAKKWLKGRKGLFNRLRKINPEKKNLLWFHCASLGEFEQIRPLLEYFRKKYDVFILLTFFSPSGYESKKQYQEADHIDYLPMDTSQSARKFVEICNPRLSFFAKYEFWFNLLRELNRHGKASFLISGIFRKEQQFFQFYGAWFARQLHQMNHFFVQDKNSAQLLKGIEIESVSISGDSRFDRVKEIADQKIDFPQIETFISGQKTVVFGSSWTKENELAFALSKKYPELKLIIAPHEFNMEEFEALSEQHQNPIQYYSELENASEKAARILVIDHMGILAKIYRYADVAVIGGGFGKGIHNILEAAVYGIPVMFGPNYRIFNEAHELLDIGGAKVFKNETQFLRTIGEILNDKSKRMEIGSSSATYFEKKVGATLLIINVLKDLNYLEPLPLKA